MDGLIAFMSVGLVVSNLLRPGLFFFDFSLFLPAFVVLLIGVVGGADFQYLLNQQIIILVIIFFSLLEGGELSEDDIQYLRIDSTLTDAR